MSLALDKPAAVDKPAVDRASNRRERWRGLAMAFPPIAVVALFIGFPVVTALLYTFGYVNGPNDAIASLGQDQVTRFPSVGAYQKVLADPSARASLSATVIVTILTVVIVLVISWLVALYARLAGSRLAKVVSALSVTPLFIPVVIASYAILTFYAPDGFLHSLATTAGLPGFPRVSYTLSAVTIGEVWVNLPFGVLLMTSGLNAVPNVLIDAARDVGSSLTRTVRTILLPMNIVPTVIVGTFTAIYVLGSFTVPYITGPNAPNLLGTAMTFSFMSYGRPQQAEVMAAIVFVLAAGIGTLYVWANLRSERRSGTRR